MDSDSEQELFAACLRWEENGGVEETAAGPQESLQADGGVEGGEGGVCPGHAQPRLVPPDPGAVPPPAPVHAAPAHSRYLDNRIHCDVMTTLHC